jgi:2-C-methyl-D-erythritol 4-phosphate cytidylyltransferase
MLTYTINALLRSKKINAVMVVINPFDIELYNDSIKKITDQRLLPYCFGGIERSDSVKLGLKKLKRYNPRKVLIHDAARPFITTKTINKVLKSLEKNDAVLPVLPIFDAIWRKSNLEDDNETLTPGPDRTDLICAQTPQGFNYSVILSAYLRSTRKGLDDVTIAYDAGVKIKTVIGDENNSKVTSVAQLRKFKGIIK